MKLRDVCEIQYGYAFDSSQFSSYGGMPLIRIRDVKRGYTETCTTEPFEDKYVIKDGEMLIGMDGEFNIAKWRGGAALLNQRVCCVRPKENTDSDFIYYYLSSVLGRIEAKTSFVTVKHLSAKTLNAIDIPPIPAKKQERIAEQFRTIDVALDKRERQLLYFEAIVKSRFVEMFGDLVSNSCGWKYAPLSELCDVRDGTHDSPKYHDAGFPLLTSKNFSQGFVDFDNANLISQEDFEAINRRSQVDLGDIIMPMIGTIGHPVIVDTDRKFAIKNVALIKMDGSALNSAFLKALLESEYFDDIVASRNRGATQKFISLGIIRGLEVPVVPDELQREFATFVQQVDKSKAAVQKSIEKLELLKASLMQEYFG